MRSRTLSITSPSRLLISCTVLYIFFVQNYAIGILTLSYLGMLEWQTPLGKSYGCLDYRKKGIEGVTKIL